MASSKTLASWGAGASTLFAGRAPSVMATTSRLTALFHRMHEVSDLGAGSPQLGGSYWADRRDLPTGTDLPPW
jgi:hypothetical protein